MSKPTYWEMLQDPRWQRKRLEVLERADFKCVDCGAADKTLHVHHMYYERGKALWEYENVFLRCLCEDCHLRIQAVQADISQFIAGLHTRDLGLVRGFVEALNMLARHRTPGMFVPFIGSGDLRPEDRGALMAFGLTADEAQSLVRDGRLYVSDVFAFIDRRDEGGK